MGKYLDSIDYNKIVFNTFQLPEKDFYKYYSNKVEDHYSDNPDLFDELVAAIERRIEWYRDCHPDDYSVDEWMLDKDGNSVLDNNGNRIKITRILNFKEADQVFIPLAHYLPGYAISRSINKSFFDQQINIVQSLSIEQSLSNLVLKQKITAGRTRKSINDLFGRKEIADKVFKIFIDNDYLISGKWNYQGNNKSIATPFYVLQEYFGLIQEDGTPQGTRLKIWCNALGINANDGFIRNLKKNPANGNLPTLEYKRERKEFFILFKPHFKALKELPD